MISDKTDFDGAEGSICAKCCTFLGATKETCVATDGDSCSICLGLWQDATNLQDAIRRACEPYGGVAINRFSSEQPPSVGIPGDVALRYHLASWSDEKRRAVPSSAYLRELKNHIKAAALVYVESSQLQRLQGYPPCVESEEQGFLCVHVIITPAIEVQRPANFCILNNHKRARKRFRGHDPTEKQGGDPRKNFEARVARSGRVLWPVADVESVFDRGVPPGSRQDWIDWFRSSGRAPKTATQYHVAVWRRPFFVRALYTKARRDVSQTPFYVPSDDNKSVMKRMGITSVEEQITPVLAKEACGGISTLNNNADAEDVVYGMVKFHASGREDMNVRMILPPDPSDTVGGRPFVCQVVDALQLPSPDALRTVQQSINCSIGLAQNGNHAIDNHLHSRIYGKNPMGVGISDCFSFTPSNSFKNLQAETEEKVKFYGCLCWSENIISSETDLTSRLGSYPLQLKQKTPIRVLHRRSNTIRIRHVLTLTATRINEHYFRLNLSTDAGTYVKEFVHGDFGRTHPNVSSLLGCKTDIFELDCEGIEGG